MSEAIKRRANKVLSAAASLPDRCRTARRTASESRDLAPHLPFLRRYATALTCSQSSGDAYVCAALSALLAGDQGLVDQASSRAGLYRLFHAIWATTSARLRENDGRMNGTGPQSLGAAKRAVLLLTRMEAFSPDEVAFITAQPMKTVRRIVGDAARKPNVHPNILAACGASDPHRHLGRA
jgi:DNA-directed RNA polymerase specialized sigma24 family protein